MRRELAVTTAGRALPIRARNSRRARAGSQRTRARAADFRIAKTGYQAGDYFGSASHRPSAGNRAEKKKNAATDETRNALAENFSMF